MLWIRVWSPGVPAGAGTGWSTAMDGRLLPLLCPVVVAVVAVVGILAGLVALAREDLRDVVPALFHAHQAEAEVRDDVAHEVVRLLSLRGEQQDVPRARQASGAVENLHLARVQRLAHRARAVRMLVAVGDLDRERGRGLHEVRGGTGTQELAAVDDDDV